MAALTQHIVTGRTGKKPELRYTPSGKAVTSFSVCSQPRRLNQQTQQWEDGAETWYEVNTFGREAENIVASVVKGMEVTVFGKLKTGSYVNKEGITVATLEITSDAVLIPLDHQIVNVVDTRAYGNKTSGGVAAPAGNGWNNQQAAAPAANTGWGAADTEAEPF